VTRDPLHFSHANGFPAGCYRKFFSCLAADYRIGAIDRIGHDPAYPATDGWPHLVAQLIDHLVAQHRQPVIGVGHSLGGYLTFMAAVQRPELFQCIVLLDAPIIGYFKGTAFGLVKRLGLADRVTPAGATRDRRREWQNEDEMIAHFRRRRLFRDFDPDCLRDYARLGTVAEGARLRLAFDPEIEYAIYRGIPHDMVTYTQRLRVPAGYLGGRGSQEAAQIGLAHTRRHFRVKRIDGGHLFPLERPAAAAVALRELIGELLEKRSPAA
jgi:pimeloyl-ACP methyl ester carboxylesterase